MRKYEYKILRADSVGIAQLNELGQEGWEHYAMLHHGSVMPYEDNIFTTNVDYFDFYFKREVPKETVLEQGSFISEENREHAEKTFDTLKNIGDSK